MKKTRKRTGPRRRRLDSALIRELREQVRFFKKQFHFYQGKCERLELAAMTAARTPAGEAYVARTDQATQPPPKEEVPKKLTHAQLQEKWDALSPKEQEEHIAQGNWDPLAEMKKKPKARAN